MVKFGDFVQMRENNSGLAADQAGMAQAAAYQANLADRQTPLPANSKSTPYGHRPKGSKLGPAFGGQDQQQQQQPAQSDKYPHLRQLMAALHQHATPQAFGELAGVYKAAGAGQLDPEAYELLYALPGFLHRFEKTPQEIQQMLGQG